ncbi:MAG: hypothetical protein PHV63_03945 [Candidatus Daviesbacteria bacterium]|nr:hypothetical protein [Candidatus Daviesbacteria bacterium]
MRLAERLAQTEAEAATREQTTMLEVQRQLQVAEAARLKDEAEITQRVAQREADRRTALNALVTKLSPLLEIVGARDQLEEARKFWKTGVIDPTPQLIFGSSTPSLSLALRHRYITLGLHIDRGGPIWDYDRYVGHEPDKHTGSYLQLYEDAIFVVVNESEDIPTIQAYSGSQALTYRTFPGSFESGSWEFRYFAQAKPEQFQITNPDQARKLLEDQLFHVLQGFKPPLDWQEKVEAEIAGDKFLSPRYAQDYYSSLLRSTSGRQPKISIPWYRRLFL